MPSRTFTLSVPKWTEWGPTYHHLARRRQNGSYEWANCPGGYRIGYPSVSPPALLTLLIPTCPGCQVYICSLPAPPTLFPILRVQPHHCHIRNPSPFPTPHSVIVSTSPPPPPPPLPRVPLTPSLAQRAISSSLSLPPHPHLHPSYIPHPPPP